MPTVARAAFESFQNAATRKSLRDKRDPIFVRKKVLYEEKSSYTSKASGVSRYKMVPIFHFHATFPTSQPFPG